MRSGIVQDSWNILAQSTLDSVYVVATNISSSLFFSWSRPPTPHISSLTLANAVLLSSITGHGPFLF